MNDENRYQGFNITAEPFYKVRVAPFTGNKRFLYPDEIGITTCSPAYCISNYNLHPYLLSYIKQGTLGLSIPNHTYILHEGDCFFIDTSRPHIYYNASDKELTMVWMHIGGEDAGVYYDFLLERSKTNVYHPDEMFVNEFTQFVIEYCSNDISDPFAVSAGILHILAALETGQDEQENDMNTVINYIHEHYSENISLDTLCHIASMSKSRLISRFKDSFGNTPYQYIINTRLAMAYHKLICSRISIDELAYSVGFNSPAAFIDSFKKKYGMTPGRLRTSSADFNAGKLDL